MKLLNFGAATPTVGLLLTAILLISLFDAARVTFSAATEPTFSGRLQHGLRLWPLSLAYALEHTIINLLMWLFIAALIIGIVAFGTGTDPSVAFIVAVTWGSFVMALILAAGMALARRRSAFQ